MGLRGNRRSTSAEHREAPCSLYAVEATPAGWKLGAFPSSFYGQQWCGKQDDLSLVFYGHWRCRLQRLVVGRATRGCNLKCLSSSRSFCIQSQLVRNVDVSTHVVRSSSGSMWSPQGVQTLSGPVVGNHQTHFKVSQRQTKIRSCLTSLQSEASDAQQHLTFIWFLMIHYRELCILGKISSFLSLFQNGDSSKQITAYESFPFLCLQFDPGLIF